MRGAGIGLFAVVLLEEGEGAVRMKFMCWFVLSDKISYCNQGIGFSLYPPKLIYGFVGREKSLM